jgi:hypothetical protein
MGDSMSTIINATTTNGVVIQPDNSGSLVLQTNNGTAAVTIDTSQRAAFVAGTAAAPAITTAGDTNTGMWFPAADTIAFSEGGAESMRIDSSGNVGIGTASPTVKADIVGISGVTRGMVLRAASDNGAYLQLTDLGSHEWYVGTPNGTNALVFGDSRNTASDGTERMRIDSNGQNTMTTTIGYAQLRNVTGTTVAASGTVDFPNMSGIIIVNNWTQGSVVIFSCGGGSVTTVNTNGLYGGSVAYRSAVGGYRWTSNHPSSADYSFTVIATRITA